MTLIVAGAAVARFDTVFLVTDDSIFNLNFPQSNIELTDVIGQELFDRVTDTVLFDGTTFRLGISRDSPEAFRISARDQAAQKISVLVGEKSPSKPGIPDTITDSQITPTRIVAFEEIQRRAFELFLQNSAASALDNWLTAERELLNSPLPAFAGDA